MVRDISMLIHAGMGVWPGDEPPRQGWNERIAEGGAANVSHWTFGSHTGTHVDAPQHFLDGGAAIDEIPLERLIGAADVVNVGDSDGPVQPHMVAVAIPQGCRRLLLRTANSRRLSEGFDRSFVSLDAAVGDVLQELGIETLGVDYLSVERFVDEHVEPDCDYPVHRALLGAGITVIEGLDLSAVLPGATTSAACPSGSAGRPRQRPRGPS